MREPGSQAVLAAGVGGRQLVEDSLVAEAVGSSEIAKQK